MKTYFVRHAESTANAHGDRSRDPPLSTLGFEQAKGVGGFAHTVICSTLTRARQTLFHSELRCHRILFSELCREIRGGNPCDYLPDEDQGVHETADEINERARRLRAMIDGLRHESPSEVVAVFSHHCFIGHVTGVWPANCQIVPAEGW